MRDTLNESRMSTTPPVSWEELFYITVCSYRARHLFISPICRSHFYSCGSLFPFYSTSPTLVDVRLIGGFGGRAGTWNGTTTSETGHSNPKLRFHGQTRRPAVQAPGDLSTLRLTSMPHTTRRSGSLVMLDIPPTHGMVELIENVQ